MLAHPTIANRLRCLAGTIAAIVLVGLGTMAATGPAAARTTGSLDAPSSGVSSSGAPSNTAPSNTAPSNTAPSNTAPSNTVSPPDISVLEGGVVQTRPGYLPGGSTAPPLGPMLGPSPTASPNEWSPIMLAVLLTVTPLVTVAALLWMSRKPLPAGARRR